MNFRHINYEEYKIDYFYINGQLIIKRDIEQNSFGHILLQTLRK